MVEKRWLAVFFVTCKLGLAQWFPTFFDAFLPLLILHSTKSTHFSYRCYFFILGKMCFAAGWNGFAGRIWPPGRSVENPDIGYEEEWWQHTPFLESNTNTERLWVNPVDTDTIFWTGGPRPFAGAPQYLSY